MGVFTHAYADAYDSVYADKAYADECDLIDEVLQLYGAGEVESVIDLGCGTGGHAIPLAMRGYDVTGVDRSSEMLAHAREKSATANTRVRWLEGDIRSIDLGKIYDTALLMFAVLSYQVSNADVLATLRGVRRHLPPGGLAVFDVWYGPGVLTERPRDRKKVVATPAGALIRSASAELDTRRQLCRVRYELSAVEAASKPTVETHVLRYFFPMELELFLESAGMKLLHLSPPERLDAEPDEQTWNVLAVAAAE